MFTTIHFTKEYNIELMYKYVQNVIEMFEDTKWARYQNEQDTKLLQGVSGRRPYMLT
jgi:hypothetical protein